MNGPPGRRVGASPREEDAVNAASWDVLSYSPAPARPCRGKGRGGEVSVSDLHPQPSRSWSRSLPTGRKFPEVRTRPPGATSTPGLAGLPGGWGGGGNSGSLGQPRPFPGRKHLGLFTGRLPCCQHPSGLTEFLRVLGAVDRAALSPRTWPSLSRFG